MVPSMAHEAFPPIPDDAAELKTLVHQLLLALQDRERNIQKLEHQLEQLKKRLYGPKSEKWTQEPGLFAELLDLMEAAKESEAEPEPESAPVQEPVTPPRRKGHGRRKPAAHLPRVRIVHELPPDQCQCAECQGELQPFGEEVSEQIDYIPAVAYVKEQVRVKYACPACQGNVVTAPAPSKPLGKGLPGAGLLAQVLVSKYGDHLPLHRQAGIFRRHGLDLNRSTLGDWVAASASQLKPLVERMKAELWKSKVVHTDDTPVPVRDGSRKQTRQGRLWVYHGDGEHPMVVYDYTAGRSRAGPERMLKTYTGYLQADAYAGYDRIYARGERDPARRVVEVGCWAHARRKFVEAEASDPARSLLAKARIRLLYQVEKEAREMDPEARRALRREKAAPVLEAFREWLEAESRVVLPKSPIGAAIQYALNQWTALTRYLEDGDLAIDNNAAERALRPVAVGRKNWLFAGSDKGGERAAIVYSVIETCKRHGVDPFAYLRDVLDRIGDHPVNALEELFPENWTPRPYPQPDLEPATPAAPA